MMIVNEDNFEREVVRAETPVIIDFFADWCGPCQMMAPVFESVGKEYHGKLKFVKLNTEEAPEIAQEFDVQGIPCLIITSKGKEVDRIIGFRDAGRLKQAIDEVLKRM